MSMCLRDCEQRTGLLTNEWRCRSFLGGLKVKPCGFVTNMAEWMSASDVIITKAGPGTIAEALICGLPIILNGFIPCQVGSAPANRAHATGSGKADCQKPRNFHVLHRKRAMCHSWLTTASAHLNATQHV